MQKFIQNILAFFLLSIVVILLLFLVLKIGNLHKLNLKVNGSKHILVLGDSHTQRAFNDTIYKAAVNFSGSGESYFYHYIKLRMLLNNNTHIDTVYLGYSSHNIAAYQDKRFYQTDYIQNKLPCYLIFFEAGEFIEIFIGNPTAVLFSFKKIALSLIKRFNTKAELREIEVGSFKNNITTRLDITKVDKTTYQELYQSPDLAPKEIKYLKKIISFCASKKVTLLLLNAPIHPILSGINNQFKQHSQKFYKMHLKEVPLLDYEFLFDSDSVFSDLHHLNLMGSVLFTQNLMKDLSTQPYSQ